MSSAIFYSRNNRFKRIIICCHALLFYNIAGNLPALYNKIVELKYW